MISQVSLDGPLSEFDAGFNVNWSKFRGNIGEYNRETRQRYAGFIKQNPACDVYEPNRRRLVQEGLLKAE